MNNAECGRVRDVLPLYAARDLGGRELSEIEEHLADCSECGEEARLVVRLRAARPEPPAYLLPSILEAATARPVGAGRSAGRPERSWPERIWNVRSLLQAAAVALIALGIGTFLRPNPVEEPMWAMALEPEATVEWYGPEWMVAGEPQLEALTDDQLRALLEELEQ